jgi:integrase
VLKGAAEPDEIRIPTLIASYGGQRLTEILDCSTHDVVLQEGVWCLSIRMKHRAKGTRLKTKTSRRIVPLHPSVTAAVLEYRDRIVKEHGHGPLFPQIAPDAQNRRGNRGGKKIGKWIRNGLGITREEVSQSMHGFRHYVRTTLLAKKVDRKIRNM